MLLCNKGGFGKNRSATKYGQFKGRMGNKTSKNA